MNKTEHYTRTAIFMHWLIGLGMIGMLALGLYMVDMPFSPGKLQIYSWHKWAGMTLLVLSTIRLAWRLSHPSPKLPDSMGALSRLVAHAGHWTLYILMITIPLSGWLMSSAQGFPVVWFGVLPLPNLVAKNVELGNLLQNAHVILNYALIVVLIGHISAALLHHFIKKDTILSRMLPFIKHTSS